MSQDEVLVNVHAPVALPMPVAVPIAHHAPAPPTSLINSICASLKVLRKNQPLLMPIKKIKNIGVEVSITKEKKSVYVLDIIPTEFRVQDDSLYEAVYNKLDTECVTEDDFIRFVIENVLKTLRVLNIDKLNGNFITGERPPHVLKMDAMWEEFCQEFKDDETIELAMNECCVCFSLTKTKTNCGHTVCLECVSKIQRDPNEYLKRCPLCRQQIKGLA